MVYISSNLRKNFGFARSDFFMKLTGGGVVNYDTFTILKCVGLKITRLKEKI